MTPLYRTSVYLQLIAFRSILDSASRKQLMGVLDLHEIAYSPGDSMKKLRLYLKRHICSIERCKLHEAELRCPFFTRPSREPICPCATLPPSSGKGGSGYEPCSYVGGAKNLVRVDVGRAAS